MKTQVISLLFVIAIVSGCGSPANKSAGGIDNQIVYEETWESLAQHNEEPEWFKDAKLGIYFHWGPYSVPAFGDEWYPRWMHFENRREYTHHLENYGHPSEFGYHDFIPMFTAEHFDANEWAELFRKAGARFAGPVAEHHDGFAMWASEITPWNSLDMGPKRDITGELSVALRERGMKLITTFHHDRHLQRYADKPDETRYNDSHYPLFPGMPPATTSGDFDLLYGNIPEDKWHEEIWFGKLKEVIDKYQPDIIWFDSWLDKVHENYRQKFCAYYLNEAQKWNKEVVIVRKQDDLPLDVSVDDLEKSRKNRLDEKAWMTDETISTGSWCYTENLVIKPAGDMIHVLIDIVSKNGVLLLNISPKADGTIPAEQKEVLLAMGDWLERFGEAIYDTRPWYTFGEGPTVEPEGHFQNHREFLKIKYSNKDIRYTTKGKVIYATILGWPGNGEEVNLTAFAADKLPGKTKIKNISLLGSSGKIKWSLTPEGLKVKLPETAPDQNAVVLKIKT
jgi:alpha-L-fucosidase